MKFFAYVFLFIIILLTGTSFLLPTKEKRQFSDDALRVAALSRNMSSTPARFEDLLLLVDTPDNRLSKEKINLGRDLYHETMLSKNRDISCATCHVLSKDLKEKNIYLKALTSKTNNKTDCIICHLSDQSGTDRFETAVGDGGAENPYHLNTLTTLNAALAKYQTWDGDVKTTAMVLYALTDEVYTPITPINTSSTCGNSVIDSGEDCEFTSDCNETGAKEWHCSVLIGRTTLKIRGGFF